ncbi:chromosome partition protein Smc-like [Hoplias malabaricus]|uniref:chromosome partition protein Smc-like n=1 Tax=Hoplias malabaricus TaxID=27720 RepID=UPI0034627FFD
MADSKEIVPLTSGPGFIDELLPSSQQISLLFQLSYLCLGKFPKLERLLRMRAVETQLLFKSSEAVMLKCVERSQNLVSSLLPKLINAIEKNKTTEAVKDLEEARLRIFEMIQDVDKMLQRYETLNKDVATTTSNIITEKKETEVALQRLSEEQQAIKDSLKKLEEQLKDTNAETEEIQRKIDAKNNQLQREKRDFEVNNAKIGLMTAMVPFFGPIIKSVVNSNFPPEAIANIKRLEAELNGLHSSKASAKQRAWDLQVQLIDKRKSLAKIQTDQGIIPKPTHLQDVQVYLSKNQKVFIELKAFWNKVHSLLGVIKDKNFVGEDLIDYPDLKEKFLKSIHTSSEIWGMFGASCNKSVQIFQSQANDAYKFLEIDPASLSTEEWQKQYDHVKNQLEDLKVSGNLATSAIEK